MEARFKPIFYNFKQYKPELRRADLFVLDKGTIVEVETNPKTRKKGAITVYV